MNNIYSDRDQEEVLEYNRIYNEEVPSSALKLLITQVYNICKGIR